MIGCVAVLSSAGDGGRLIAVIEPRPDYQTESAATRSDCAGSSRTTGTTKACEAGRWRTVVAGTVMVGSLVSGGACGSGSTWCGRPGVRQCAAAGSARGSWHSPLSQLVACVPGRLAGVSRVVSPPCDVGIAPVDRGLAPPVWAPRPPSLVPVVSGCPRHFWRSRPTRPRAERAGAVKDVTPIPPSSPQASCHTAFGRIAGLGADQRMNVGPDRRSPARSRYRARDAPQQSQVKVLALPQPRSSIGRGRQADQP